MKNKIRRQLIIKVYETDIHGYRFVQRLYAQHNYNIDFSEISTIIDRMRDVMIQVLKGGWGG